MGPHFVVPLSNHTVPEYTKQGTHIGTLEQRRLSSQGSVDRTLLRNRRVYPSPCIPLFSLPIYGMNNTTQEDVADLHVGSAYPHHIVVRIRNCPHHDVVRIRNYPHHSNIFDNSFFCTIELLEQ